MNHTRPRWLLIVSLGFLNALTPFSIDLYLPAFAEIARDLSSSVAQISLTLSIYFVGYALGQILCGPFLDYYGRKKPLYFGLALYLLASLGCASARSAEALFAFRFLSALGGSVASVGAMASVRDFFPVREGAKVFSMLMLVLSVSPMLAPTLGSMLVTAWSWRVLFVVLAGIAVVDIAIVAFVLPNTYRRPVDAVLSLTSTLRVFREILGERIFWVYSVAGALAFATMFVFLAASPDIFMRGFGLSPRAYGAVFALLAGGMIGGGQLNNLLLKWADSRKIFAVALLLQTVGALAFAILAHGATLSLVPTLILFFVVLSCCGVTYPNAVSVALAPFADRAGRASALLGCLQITIGAIISSMVGLLTLEGVPRW